MDMFLIKSLMDPDIDPPETGVTFPFVSRGGSSLLSCWMMMAYLKAADNRKEASFAVRPGDKFRTPDAPQALKERRDEFLYVPEEEEEDDE